MVPHRRLLENQVKCGLSPLHEYTVKFTIKASRRIKGLVSKLRTTDTEQELCRESGATDHFIIVLQLK